MPTQSVSLPEAEAPGPAGRPATHRWLLFVHQLPASPSNLRVRTWRRLQQLGAIAVKQAVYALPDSPAAREDFEWLKTEIESAGGQASVFSAGGIDAWSDDELVREFRRSRHAAYTELAGEIENVLKKLGAPRRRQGRRAPAARRLLELFRQRLGVIERVDFFGSAGRDRVAALVVEFESRITKRTDACAAARSAGATDPPSYRGRLWVTRPRPGVDRMGSAWLIRRFIDPDGRFGFVQDRDAAPVDAIRFDMFGVEFTHRGEQCTFETLCAVFQIDDAAVRRLAAIVHDLDLKDGRFGALETGTVGMVVEGLQLAYADDNELLAQGIVLFDALYRAVEREIRPSGPRMVAGTSGTRRTRRLTRGQSDHGSRGDG